MNYRNTVIGNFAGIRLDVQGAFVIGDGCIATESERVMIGTHLFGKEIPEHVKRLCERYPEAFEWVIRNTLRACSRKRAITIE